MQNKNKKLSKKKAMYPSAATIIYARKKQCQVEKESHSHTAMPQ